MTIALLPAGDTIPVTAEEQPPIKKGRGRPPGSKNKTKAPVEAAEPPEIESHVDEPELAGESSVEPTIDELPEEEPEPPTPKPRTRKPRRPPSPSPSPPRRKRAPQRRPVSPPPPPPSPRAQKRMAMVDYRVRQQADHNARRDRYTVMLDRFMT